MTIRPTVDFPRPALARPIAASGSAPRVHSPVYMVWPDGAAAVEPAPASDTAAAVSSVKAALRQAEATPAMAMAANQATPSAAVASMNTAGLKSRVVLSGPRPSVIEIGCPFRAATRIQSKAVAVAAIASPTAATLVPKKTTTVQADEMGRRTIWTTAPASARGTPVIEQEEPPDGDGGDHFGCQPDQADGEDGD